MPQSNLLLTADNIPPDIMEDCIEKTDWWIDQNNTMLAVLSDAKNKKKAATSAKEVEEIDALSQRMIKHLEASKQLKKQNFEAMAKKSSEAEQISIMESDEEFRPSSFSKRKRLLEDSQVTKVELPSFSSNRFGIFNELELLNTQPSTSSNKVKKSINSQNDKSKNSGKGELNLIKKAFCPPIFLANVDINHLIKQLKEIEPKINFKIVNINAVKSKLLLDDPIVHQEMMKTLREKNVDSYSFTPKELKSPSLILRGLCIGTQVSDVETALNELIPDTISKITKFFTKFSVANNTETGLFLVSLKPGKKITIISNIKYILNQSIKWEAPKSNRKEIQCKRCQKWGHFARNCNRKYQCVKCNCSHEPGGCLLPKGINDNPFCINCQQSGHPANWRGCPEYKKYLSNKKQKILDLKRNKELAANRVNFAVQNSFVSSNKSYASNFYKNDNKSQSPLISEFLKIAKTLCDAEPTIEDQIEFFLKNFRKWQKDHAKSECSKLLKLIEKQYAS